MRVSLVLILSILVSNGGYTQKLRFSVYELAKRTKDATSFVYAIGNNSDNVMALLDAPGHYTVFAPSNEAMKRIPSNIARNQTLMESLIMWHIANKTISAKPTSFIDDSTVETLRKGTSLRLNNYDLGSLLSKRVQCINGIRVIKHDIVPAQNGRVYILDDVINPLPVNDAFTLIAKNPDLSTLSLLLAKAGLDLFLKDQPHVTLFAPTNEAFQKLSSDQITTLLLNSTIRTETMNYHILRSTYYTGAVPDGKTQPFDTEDSLKKINIKNTAGTYTVNSARIITANMTVTNGVIHVIDKVLIPSF